MGGGKSTVFEARRQACDAAPSQSRSVYRTYAAGAFDAGSIMERGACTNCGGICNVVVSWGARIAFLSGSGVDFLIGRFVPRTWRCLDG